MRIPDWQPPWPYRGDLRLLRISSTVLGAELKWTCPEQVAAKARPAVSYQEYIARDYSDYQSFWLGLARDALLQTLPPWPGGSPLRAGAASDAVAAIASEEAKGMWAQESLEAARQGTAGYLRALEQIRTDEPGWTDATFTADMVWSDTDGADTVEQFAWGIHIIRDNQAIRETHFLRYRDAGTRPLPDSRIRGAAAILVNGQAASFDPWWEPAQPDIAHPGPPQRVIVREVGVLDGSTAILLDLPAEEARSHSGAAAGSVAVLTGGSYNPGGRCASCKYLPHCSGVSRPYGLLGVTEYSPWTRALTPGDLTDHQVCPHRLWLRRELGLPAERSAPTASASRGIRVHQWLEHAHGRAIACTEDDLPTKLPNTAAELGWTENEYLAVRPWLLRHLPHCPLQQDDITDVQPEASVSVFDTDANVIFSTRVDLTYRHPRRGLVLRETKTMTAQRLRDTAGDDTALIELFPQVAFSVASLAMGWDPIEQKRRDTGQGPGAVEVEVLGDTYDTVVHFDPSDADTALAARIALAQAVDAVITDTEHTPQPGYHCRWCPVRHWCHAAAPDPTAVGEIDSVELSDQQLADVATIWENQIEEEEEIPF